MTFDDERIEVTDVAAVPPEEVAPGIVRRDLRATGRARGWIVDFAAGTQWPEVDVHEDEERYFVLDGEVIEGDRRHPAGTYVVLPPGSSHRPRSDIGARLLGINIGGPGR
jgi:anti-sigma factor ChrR (cupin superfamily)